MYQTIDEMNEGRFFWRSMTQVWPIPFAMHTATEAVLSIENEPFAVICWADDGIKDRRRMQFFEQEDVVLEVALTSEMEFVHAVAMGVLLDEVAALSAMRLLAPLGSATWSLGNVTDVEEGEHV